MLKRNTVFVLGAGASVEAGLPMGADLTRQIAECLDLGYEDGNFISGDPVIKRALYHLASQLRCRVPDVADRITSIRRSMYQIKSIDTYLETHKDDALLVACGKLAIARCILDAEARSAMSVSGEGHEIDWANMSGSWYPLLWEVLSDGVSGANVSGIFNKASFIVFNYDRCLESVLFDGLINHYRLNTAQAQAIASKVLIFHPYGTVGSLPWQSPRVGAVSWFGGSLNEASLIAASDQIRTFSEQMGDDEALKRMHYQITQADRLVFLGFGYHNPNIRLLAPVTIRATPCEVLATSLGVPKRDEQSLTLALRNLVRGQSGQQVVSQLHDMKCRDFMFEFKRTLQS